LGKPPPQVLEVGRACCTLLANSAEELSWKDVQKMMSNPTKFMTDMQSLDLDQISEEAISKCRIYTALPWFTFDVVMKASVAAAHVAHWVIHVVAYHDSKNKCGSMAQQVLGEETRSKLQERSVKLEEDKAKAAVTKEECTEVEKEKQIEDQSAKLEGASEIKESRTKNMSVCKADITELKSLAKPPAAVHLLMGCVQVLLGNEEDSGSTIKVLKDPKLLSKLMEYRKEDTTPEQLQKAQFILDSNDVFCDDKLKEVSKAAYGLLGWVRAVLSDNDSDMYMPCPNLGLSAVTTAPRYW